MTKARVAILEGEGRHFSAGIDLQMMSSLMQEVHDDCDGRAREKLRPVPRFKFLSVSDLLSLPPPRWLPFAAAYVLRSQFESAQFVD